LEEEMEPDSLPRFLQMQRDLGREDGFISSFKMTWKGISEGGDGRHEENEKERGDGRKKKKKRERRLKNKNIVM
jgi:hypothetical protein